ncbi:hypothetical protein BU17DRAFT_91821 [Hysterangium stoloniferum]|nr:hypothetical protein BU17DRAFT_91821 [Hysterangium stoloniferum]
MNQYSQQQIQGSVPVHFPQHNPVIAQNSQFYGSLIDGQGHPSQILCRMVDALFFYADANCPQFRGSQLIEPFKLFWLYSSLGIEANKAQAMANNLFTMYSISQVPYSVNGQGMPVLDRQGYLHLNMFETLGNPEGSYDHWNLALTTFGLCDPMTNLVFPAPLPRNAFPSAADSMTQQRYNQWQAEIQRLLFPQSSTATHGADHQGNTSPPTTSYVAPNTHDQILDQDGQNSQQQNQSFQQYSQGSQQYNQGSQQYPHVSQQHNQALTHDGQVSQEKAEQDLLDRIIFYGELITKGGYASDVLSRLIDALFTYVDEKCPELTGTQCIEPKKQMWLAGQMGLDRYTAYIISKHLDTLYNLANACYHCSQDGEPILNKESYTNLVIFGIAAKPDESHTYWNKILDRFGLVDPTTKKPFPRPIPRDAFEVDLNPYGSFGMVKTNYESWKTQLAEWTAKRPVVSQSTTEHTPQGGSDAQNASSTNPDQDPQTGDQRPSPMPYSSPTTTSQGSQYQQTQSQAYTHASQSQDNQRPSATSYSSPVTTPQGSQYQQTQSQAYTPHTSQANQFTGAQPYMQPYVQQQTSHQASFAQVGQPQHNIEALQMMQKIEVKKRDTAIVNAGSKLVQDLFSRFQSGGSGAN